MDGPAAAPHQRGFDEVMAEDGAAEGFAPLEMRQARLFGEGLGADDGIMAPVIAFRSMPPGNPLRDQRTIDAAGELLHPREQRRAIDDDRQCLDQPDTRILLHGSGHAHDRLAFHQAVGVKGQHQRIGAAEAPHPFGDIAGLALGVLGSAAIENMPAAGVRLGAQRQEGGFLGDPDIRIRRVAQNENVELRALPGRRERFMDGAEPGHHPRRAFIIGRHQKGCLAVQSGQRTAPRDAETEAATAEAGEKPAEGTHEGQRHPGKEHDEKRQHQNAEDARTIAVEHEIHLLTAGGRH